MCVCSFSSLDPEMCYRRLGAHSHTPLRRDCKAQGSVSIHIHPVNEEDTRLAQMHPWMRFPLLPAQPCVFRADCLRFPKIWVL